MSHFVAPSILAADFANLQRDIEMINRSVADWIHVDIMDGLFVPNISFGFPVVEAVKKHAEKPLDVHLMITAPDRYLERFKEAGANHITVHYEACTHLNRTIHTIKQLGCKAGVALNPHTPVSLLENVIRDIDVVLIMSVNPGFGGQTFIEQTYHKIGQVKQLIAETGSKALIQVDGGVELSNAKKLVATGANVLVSGSAIFASPDPEKTIHLFKTSGK